MENFARTRKKRTKRKKGRKKEEEGEDRVERGKEEPVISARLEAKARLHAVTHRSSSEAFRLLSRLHPSGPRFSLVRCAREPFKGETKRGRPAKIRRLTRAIIIARRFAFRGPRSRCLPLNAYLVFNRSSKSIE